MIDLQNIYIVLGVTFIVGISIGSFVTMASYRLPLGQDIVLKPSHCPRCNATLGVLDLFPLLSWLFFRGKCRHCRAPISARYPLIELSLGLLFVFLVLRTGLQPDTFLLALLVTELLILIVADLEHYIIPDSMQVAVFVTGLAYSIYHNRDTGDTMISIATGLSIGLALHYGYLFLRKKDALGWGDVKFLAVAGAWLPLAGFVPFLFLAGVIGTLTGILWRIIGRGAVFPFGPALAISLFLNVLFPDMLTRFV